MGFFKKRTIYEAETELALPGFTVDANGFIIFDNPALGGTGVFEVFPSCTSVGITRRDEINQKINVDKYGYAPPLGVEYGDERAEAIPQWVDFLNSLIPSEEEDVDGTLPCTHIQILIKKYDEGKYAITHGIESSISSIDSYFRENERARNSNRLQKRANDYITLLENIERETNAAQGFDFRKLNSFRTRMFVVVSYTPSSEGWWLTGRDEDYYMDDSNSPTALFEQDKLVDFFTSRSKSKEKDDAPDTDDLFLLEEEQTAAIINTRMNQMERKKESYERANGIDFPAFRLSRLSPIEVGILVKFFPDLASPYIEKAKRLSIKEDSVIFDMKRKAALAAGKDLMSVQSAQGDSSMLLYDEEEMEEFLSAYKDPSVKIADAVEEITKRKETALETYSKEASNEQMFDDEQDDDFDDFMSLGVKIGAEQGATPTEEEIFLASYKNKSFSHKHAREMSSSPADFEDRVAHQKLGAGEHRK